MAVLDDGISQQCTQRQRSPGVHGHEDQVGSGFGDETNKTGYDQYNKATLPNPRFYIYVLRKEGQE